MSRIIEKDVMLKGRLIKLYNNCPKEDGWFGGYLKDKNYGTVAVTGICNEPVAVGMTLEITANHVINQYGKQFEASIVTVLIEDTVTMMRYLASNKFPGIGTSTAQKLVTAFGVNVLDEIAANPTGVKQTCKLSKKQMDSLSKGIVNSKLEQHFLQKYPHFGQSWIRYFVINDTFHMYNLQQLDELLAKKPYAILMDVPKLPFHIIDDVACLDIGIAWNHPARIAIIFAKAVDKTMRAIGGTYINVSSVEEMQKFHTELNKLLKHQVDVSFVQQTMAQLQKNGTIYWENLLNELHMYTPEMHEYEQKILSVCVYKCSNGFQTYKIKKLVESRQRYVDGYIRMLRQNYPMCGLEYPLCKEQEDAVKFVFAHSLSCISGGPGRGKTSVIRALANAWQQGVPGARVIMLAPTGKAVNRLKEATDWNGAETIARFFYRNIAKKTYGNEVDMDTTWCDAEGNLFNNHSETLIIIDEASMISYAEGAQLLNAFQDSWIVFVGDKNQLPPIEPGPFFYTLLASNVVPYCELVQNHRSKSSEISDNADTLLAGSTKMQYTNHFQFYPSEDEKMAEIAVNRYQTYLANGAVPSEILLMSPVNKGVGSVGDINTRLQDLVNRPFQSGVTVQRDSQGRKYVDQKGWSVPGLFSHGRQIRILDRVMNTKNHSDMVWGKYVGNDLDRPQKENGFGCYNGDMGTVIRYYYDTYSDPAMFAVLLDDGRIVTVPIQAASEWVFGYCITIHKSEGSEASKCIVLLPQVLADNKWFVESRFLNKNLLYTAITRAKDDVDLIGSPKVFKHCADNPYEYHNVALPLKFQAIALQSMIQQTEEENENGKCEL